MGRMNFNLRTGALVWFLLLLLFIVSSCSPLVVVESHELVPVEVNRSIVDALPHDSSLVALIYPRFVTVRDASQFMADDELVLAVRVGEQQKIYPLSILLWHEVINDNLSGVPFVVTYCPICGSAAAFNSEVVVAGKKKVLLFNTSGKVYDSSMLFQDTIAGYDGNGSNDNDSDVLSSLFVSFNGTAISGPRAGLILKPVTSSVGFYRDFVATKPDSLVLSRETGYNLPYGSDPYASFYSNSALLLPVAHVDSRLGLKQVVVGVRIGDVERAYPTYELEKVGVISDSVAGVDIRIERDETGFIRVVKRETGEVVTFSRTFWFLWATHNPMTTVYGMS